MPHKYWRAFKRRVTGPSIALSVLGAAITAAWWAGSHRPPVNISYCAIPLNASPNENCTSSVHLKIPRIYYAGYPLDFSEKTVWSGQHLEVAYPGMQPWHSLSWADRWRMHKVEIEIGALSGLSPRESHRIIDKGNPEKYREAAPIHGLQNKIDGNTWMGQLLLPMEPAPRVFLRCAYNKNPGNDGDFGCTAHTLVPVNPTQNPDEAFSGFSVAYHHSRLLIPPWKDVHAQTSVLVQSFITRE